MSTWGWKRVCRVISIGTKMSEHYSSLLSTTFLICSVGRIQFLMKHIPRRRWVEAIRATLLSSCDLWDFPWCIGKCSTTRALRGALQDPLVFHQPLGILAAAWEIITERQRRCNIFSCLCTVPSPHPQPPPVHPRGLIAKLFEVWYEWGKRSCSLCMNSK